MISRWSKTLAAVAIVTQINTFDYQSGQGVNIATVRVNYSGNDVPGEQTGGVVFGISIATGTAIAGVQAAICSAVRTDATNRGFTIGANQCIVPQFTGM